MIAAPIEFDFTPLSPVHIGSGETLEPFDYTLLRDRGECWIRLIDSSTLFRGLSTEARAEYDDLLRRDRLMDIREWMQRRATDASIRGTIQVQKSAFKAIEDNIKNPARLGEIHLSTRRVDDSRPFIPGSSIKGAIRTAIVDTLLDKSSHTRERRHGNVLEAEIFGSLNERGKPDLYRDPLRQLVIGDVHLRPDSCYIDRVRVVRRPGSGGRDEAEGIIMYRDITWSMLDGEPPGNVTYRGRANLLTHLTDRRIMGSATLPLRLGVETICRDCNAFYRPRLEQELDNFDTGDGVKDTLLKLAGSLAPNQALVRLGRHSHFECVTVRGASQPRRGFGATRTYVMGEFPLGWARLTLHAPASEGATR